ncbi:MAG: ArsR family transcriptional regulator [Zestosphaera sp.]
MSSGDSLRRVEELLEYVVKKLERLEELLARMTDDPTYSIALDLVLTFSIPVQKAIKMARDLVVMLQRVPEADPITKVLIEVLMSSGDEVSISELTRRVRKARGTASRRIVTEKLRVLEAEGIVTLRKSGNVTKVYLRRGGDEELAKQDD